MTFDDLLADFRRDQDALGPRGRGVRYPADFIANTGALVTLLREHGWTQHAIAETLGISWPTLLRWSSSLHHDAPAFVPLTLQDALPDSSFPSPPLTLISPTGWRLEGLDLHTALALMTGSC